MRKVRDGDIAAMKD